MTDLNTNAIDRSDLFVGTDKFTEGLPPLNNGAQFVGKFAKWAIVTKSVAIKRGADAGKTVEITTFDYYIEPLTIAVEQRTDGLIHRELPWSTNQTSLCFLLLRQIEAAMSELLGVSFKIKSKDDLTNYVVGNVFTWSDYTPKSERLNEFYGNRTEEFRGKKNVLLVDGIPDANWERTIPSNIDQLKAAAAAKAEARVAAKAAAQAAGTGDSSLPRQIGENGSSPTPTELSEEVRSQIVAVLDGLDIKDRMTSLAKNADFKKSVPNDVYKGVLSGVIVNTLVKSGQLEVVEGKYRVPVTA